MIAEKTPISISVVFRAVASRNFIWLWCACPAWRAVADLRTLKHGLVGDDCGCGSCNLTVKCRYKQPRENKPLLTDYLHARVAVVKPVTEQQIRGMFRMVCEVIGVVLSKGVERGGK